MKTTNIVWHKPPRPKDAERLANELARRMLAENPDLSRVTVEMEPIVGRDGKRTTRLANTCRLTGVA